MIEGIIFDCNGIIADSEPIRSASTRQALSKYGINLSDEEYYNFWTRQGKGLRDFLEKNNSRIDIDNFVVERREIYHTMLRKRIKPMNNSDVAIKNLHKEYPLALVTGSYRQDLIFLLDVLNLEKYFRFLIASEDIKRKKPDPEGFIMAGERLGISSERLIVIEDAEKGVIAAHNAGMKCLAVPTHATKGNDFSLAYKVLKSIEEITPEFVRSI